MKDKTIAIIAISEIPQQPQVQYDLTQQLRELAVAANKLGLYDAADFLNHNILDNPLNKNVKY